MVTLDPDTHTYTDDRGMIVPGVTGVIDHLCDYAGIPAHVLDHKSQLGTAVHKACELYDNDDLDWESVDDAVLPYLEAWIKFLDDTGFEVIENESIVYHPRHNYAGMLDRTGMLNKRYSVLDIKATATIGQHIAIQTSAYLEAHKHAPESGPVPTKRFALQLKPDRSYKLFEFKDKADFSVFLAQLTIYNWRQKHGKLIDSNP